jgi:uncharacterized protein with HEPN domain
MSRSALDRLGDILSSADLARRYGSGLDAARLAAVEQPRDAAVFRIAVIGEAASQLPAEIQALAPDIPWVSIKDMRNHIIHGYWQIDYQIVPKTIEFDLQPLAATADRLIDLIKSSET